MKIKTHKIIYFGSIFLLGTILFVLIFPYEIRDALNPNHLKVSVSKNLNISNVKIIWEARDENKQKVIFEKGKVTSLKFKEYGPNTLYVYYKDRLIGNLGHFKTNNWHGHKYIVHINKRQENFIINSTIEGPDYKEK